MLISLQVAAGVVTALILPVAMAYAGEVSPAGREGTFMGFFNLAFFTGWGLGPLVGGVLKDAGGNDAAFLGQSVLASVALAVVLLRLPESRQRVPARGDAGTVALGEMLRQRAVLALIAVQMSLAFNAGIAFAFVGVYLTDSLGAAASMVGVVLSTRVVLTGLLQIVGGRAADRLNRRMLIAAGMVISAVATFAIPAMGSVGAVWLLFAVLGIAEASSSPAANAIAVETGRAVGMGQLMGVVTTALSAGLVLGSLGGGLVESIAGIEQAFRVGGVVALGGALVALVLLKGVSARPSLRSEAGAIPLVEVPLPILE